MSSSKPSIFTSRDAFKRPPDPPARAPHNNSPLRRQSTPDALEKNRIQAAAEAAPLVLSLPENALSNTVNASIGEYSSSTKEQAPTTSIWTSFKDSERSPARQNSGSLA